MNKIKQHLFIFLYLFAFSISFEMSFLREFAIFTLIIISSNLLYKSYEMKRDLKLLNSFENTEVK